MFIQNLKQDNAYAKLKTGQCLYKTSNKTKSMQNFKLDIVGIKNLKQDNVYTKLKTG